ncbi:MAG: PilZ domain-containing protein [Tepidisphaerales bacterium]
MELTPQQHGKILLGLRPTAPASQGSEKRRHTRVSVRAQVAVAAMTESKSARSYTALTSDISIGGIGLMQSAAADKGSRLVVRLLRQNKPPLALLCTVSRCASPADGLYSVGAQFVQEAVRR